MDGDWQTTTPGKDHVSYRLGNDHLQQQEWNQRINDLATSPIQPPSGNSSSAAAQESPFVFSELLAFATATDAAAGETLSRQDAVAFDTQQQQQQQHHPIDNIVDGENAKKTDEKYKYASPFPLPDPSLHQGFSLSYNESEDEFSSDEPSHYYHHTQPTSGVSSSSQSVFCFDGQHLHTNQYALYQMYENEHENERIVVGTQLSPPEMAFMDRKPVPQEAPRWTATKPSPVASVFAQAQVHHPYNLKPPPAAAAATASAMTTPSPLAAAAAAERPRQKRKRQSRGLKSPATAAPASAGERTSERLLLGPSPEELAEAKTARAKEALRTWYARLKDLYEYKDEHGHSTWTEIGRMVARNRPFHASFLLTFCCTALLFSSLHL
jgi:hypothetical protein